MKGAPKESKPIQSKTERILLKNPIENPMKWAGKDPIESKLIQSQAERLAQKELPKNPSQS